MKCAKCSKQLPWSIEKLGKDLCYVCYQKELRTRSWYREWEKKEVKKQLEENGKYEDELITIQ